MGTHKASPTDERAPIVCGLWLHHLEKARLERSARPRPSPADLEEEYERYIADAEEDLRLLEGLRGKTFVPADWDGPIPPGDSLPPSDLGLEEVIADLQEYLRVHRRALRQVERPSERRERDEGKPDRPTWSQVALDGAASALMRSNPDWTIARLARELQTNRTRLHRLPTLKLVRAQLALEREERMEAKSDTVQA